MLIVLIMEKFIISAYATYIYCFEKEGEKREETP